MQAGIFVVLFPYFEEVLGWSGLRSTLALMPMALLMMLASGLAPQIAARIGGRSTMASGIFLGGAGLALMAAFVSAGGGYLSVLPGMLPMGLGMAELEADIRKWINEWNKDPKPFVWVKTADEILETLAAYCGLITDSGH